MLGIVVAAVAVALVVLGIVVAWVVTAVAELREEIATSADLDLVIDHINQISRDVYSEQDRIAVDVDRAVEEAADAKTANEGVETDVRAVQDRVSSIEGDLGTIRSTYASENSLSQLSSDVSDIIAEVREVSDVLGDDGGVKIKSPGASDYMLIKATGDTAELCKYTSGSSEPECSAIMTRASGVGVDPPVTI